MVARLLWAKNVSAAGGRKKRTFLGAAVGMSRFIIEPKRLREPQEGGQSMEENRDIRKKLI